MITRRIGIWGSAMLLLVTIAGCDARSRTDASLLSGEAPGGREPVTLRYSSYLLDTAQAGKVYFDAIAEFEKLHPQIQIEADFIQNNNYTAGIKIRLLGGEPMDVFDTWSPSLFEEFRALRTDMYLDLTGAEFLKEFYPNSLLPVTVGGRVYGAPEVMHSDGLLYNKTLFDSLGLEVPRTWDEFLALCVKLKGKGLFRWQWMPNGRRPSSSGGRSCRITGPMPPGRRSWRAGRSGPMTRYSWMRSRSTVTLLTGGSCRRTGRV